MLDTPLAKWSYGVIDDERLAVLVQVLRLEGTHRAYGERIEHTACITGIAPPDEGRDGRGADGRGSLVDAALSQTSFFAFAFFSLVRCL